MLNKERASTTNEHWIVLYFNRPRELSLSHVHTHTHTHTHTLSLSLSFHPAFSLSTHTFWPCSLDSTRLLPPSPSYSSPSPPFLSLSLSLSLSLTHTHTHTHTTHSVYPNLLALLLGHDTLVLHVTFVSQNHLLHIIRGMLLDITNPRLDVLKRLLIGDVVHQHNSLRGKKKSGFLNYE